MGLRQCYAVCGTELAYGGGRWVVGSSRDKSEDEGGERVGCMLLCPAYAMSGTRIAYATMHWAYAATSCRGHVRYSLSVCYYAMSGLA
eukprot:2087453-Rhodomonas_salina.5